MGGKRYFSGILLICGCFLYPLSVSLVEAGVKTGKFLRFHGLPINRIDYPDEMYIGAR